MATKNEGILRSRLVVDDKPLKRCLRQFSTLCSRYGRLSTDESRLSASHVLQEVRWFRHTVELAIQSQRRCEQEICEYSEQIRDLEDQIATSEAKVASLGDSLEVSRSHKRYRIAYDEIATEANKRPSRQRLQKDISDINADIDNLHNEETSHDALMSSLRLQYAHVRTELSRLAEMSAS
ncbi:hypothetical protein GGI05_003310, partial [Coemansia sp. RSA 2603]